MCMVEMAIFNIQTAITLKAGKQELQFMCSACHLMVFNICVKFHENMPSGFLSYGADTKIVNRHIHTQKRRKNIYPIALHTLYTRYGSCALHVISWFNICMKFHENMSSGFKLMERHENC